MSDNILIEYWDHEAQYRDKGLGEPILIENDIDSLLYDYWKYLDSLHKTNNANYETKLVA